MYSVSNAEKFSVRYTGIITGFCFSLIVLLLLILFLRNAILEKITGSTKAELTDFSDKLVRLIMSDTDKQEKIETASDVTRTFVNWYTWNRLYRWVIATCIAILLAIAGFAGTVLLAKQNAIMSLQKDQVEFQNGLQIFETQSLIRYQLDLPPTLITQTTGFKKHETLLTVNYPQCEITGTLNLRDTTFEPVANSSTLLTVKNLVERESTKLITQEVLNNLVKDKDAGVAMSALLILDELNISEKSNWYFYGENLSGNFVFENHDGHISLENSAAGIECKNCNSIQYRTSFVFPSETKVSGEHNLYMFRPNFGAGYLVDWGMFENLKQTLVLLPHTQNLESLNRFEKEFPEDFMKDTNWYAVMDDWRNNLQVQHLEVSTVENKCRAFKELCFYNPFIDCSK